jgi:hypothetical protein
MTSTCGGAGDRTAPARRRDRDRRRRCETRWLASHGLQPVVERALRCDEYRGLDASRRRPALVALSTLGRRPEIAGEHHRSEHDGGATRVVGQLLPAKRESDPMSLGIVVLPWRPDSWSSCRASGSTTARCSNLSDSASQRASPVSAYRSAKSLRKARPSVRDRRAAGRTRASGRAGVRADTWRRGPARASTDRQ